LQRILYGTSRIITEHLHESEPYSTIIKVISINILYFDLGQGADYVYRGTTTFKGIHKSDELQLSESQKELYHKQKIYELYPEYYLIKVNQFDDHAKDPLDEWIYFLKHEEIKTEFQAKGLKEAKDKLDIMKLSDEERATYESYVDDLHYQASMVESSYGMGKLEGRKEGREEGLQKGLQKGLEKGDLIGQVRAFQLVLKQTQNSKEELMAKTMEELELMLEQLKQQLL
ncbi:PD-(D/E)XK nuclease family transposase, partial [Deltaproteobacteria bacterium TL4]